MQFTMIHNNFNVSDLDRSLTFYREALGLKPVRQTNAPDDSFKLAFLSDGKSQWNLELTWLRDHPQKYDLGENEIHLAFRADDFAAAHEKHQAMGCICYENPGMGIYFIEDPDGYWLEILPVR
ncbi:MAG TPA: lactoylglutathione lyase [Clostridiales bacterium]|nr:lactoylglutathione lyase [Clostridiales bacterium]